MLQRWMITLVVSTVSCVLLTGCDPKKYSPDEPLPDVYTPSLFISSQNQYLYALDPKTGVKKWEVNVGGEVKGAPLVLGKYLIVPAVDTIYKLNVNTGAILKRYDYGGATASFVSSPAGKGTVFYIGSLDGNMYAIDAETDLLKWTYTSGAAPGTGISSSPLIYNGTVIFGAGDGSVHAVNETNGTLAWKTAVGAATDNIISSPVLSLPYLYVGGADGTLYALDPTTGANLWNYPTLDGSPILSSPAVYGGNIIFGCSDFRLYCIDSTAKQARWIVKTGDRILSSPFGMDQIVYVGGYDYYFYAYNIIDGTLKWKFKTGALVKSSPLVNEGYVYIGGYDKNFYAFDTTGAMKWSTRINGLIETSPVLYDLNKAYYPSVSGMAPF